MYSLLRTISKIWLLLFLVKSFCLLGSKTYTINLQISVFTNLTSSLVVVDITVRVVELSWYALESHKVIALSACNADSIKVMSCQTINRSCNTDIIHQLESRIAQETFLFVLFTVESTFASPINKSKLGRANTTRFRMIFQASRIISNAGSSKKRIGGLTS